MNICMTKTFENETGFIGMFYPFELLNLKSMRNNANEDVASFSIYDLEARDPTATEILIKKLLSYIEVSSGIFLTARYRF